MLLSQAFPRTAPYVDTVGIADVEGEHQQEVWHGYHHRHGRHSSRDEESAVAAAAVGIAADCAAAEIGGHR